MIKRLIGDRASGGEPYRLDSRTFQNVMKSFCSIQRIPIMDQILLSMQKAVFNVCKNLRHLSHILPIGLRLDRSKKHLPGGKLHHKEHRTADQFSAHKKLDGEEVTGGQYVPMALDKLMPG